MKKFQPGQFVSISREANVPQRYRGRTAVVDYHFKDNRVLVWALDRKSKLGVNAEYLTKI